jgi:UDP-glucose 4-epimerase
VINLGTGNGVTVKEFLVAFEHVVGKQLPLQSNPPDPGILLVLMPTQIKPNVCWDGRQRRALKKGSRMR